MNTEPAIIVSVQRQSGANVIATVDGIKKALPQLEASLPPSIKIHIEMSGGQSEGPMTLNQRCLATNLERSS